MKQVLIAGIGNIFLGDDGFGVEVVREVASRALPDGVEAGDYGISGMHLAYDIIRGYRVTILIDAVSRAEPPGTVTVLEVNPDRFDETLGASTLLDAHGMQPEAVIGMVRMLGGTFGKLFVVGCEPADVTDGMGLSPAVAAAVEPAANTVLELVGKHSDCELMNEVK